MLKVPKEVNRYRWFIFILLLLTYFFVFFHRVSTSVVKGDLEATFSLTTMQYTLLSGAYFYTYAIMQLPIGILVDTIGARKITTLSCALMAIGSIMFSVAGSFAVLFIARLLVGLGAAGIFLPILKIEVVWFREEEFGKLTGLTGAAGNLGSALAQGPLALLVAWLSWRTSFLVIGIFTACLAVAIYVFVRNRPEEKGFAPINDVLSSVPEKPRTGKMLVDILKNKYMWPIMIVNFLVVGVGFTITSWLVPYFMDVYGLTASQAGSITFFYPIMTMLMSMAMGALSDRLKRRKIIVLCMIAGVTLITGLFALIGGGRPPLTLAAVLTVALGGCAGSGLQSYGMAKDLNRPAYSGMSTSVANTAIFAGSSLVPLFFGSRIGKNVAAYGHQIAYQRMFGLFSLISFIAFIICLFVMETNCTNRYEEIKSGLYKKSCLKIK